MIYILSAPIQTGKTTSLINWSSQREDVYGILTPVKDGKRVFMNAHTREQFAMEAETGEETLDIGRFHFSKKNFEKATSIIRDDMLNPGWLVIDEIGPLELKGHGFHDVLTELLHAKKEKIILVVREGLVQQILEHFRFEADVKGEW
jgi:nucleoside-triphosphatase THEP1